MATPGEILNFLENHKCGKGVLVVHKDFRSFNLGYQCSECGEEAIGGLMDFKARNFQGASNEIVRLFDHFANLDLLLLYYTSGYLKIWDKELVENLS